MSIINIGPNQEVELDEDNGDLILRISTDRIDATGAAIENVSNLIEGIDAEDGGTTVLADATALNFTESGAAAVNVTDDGDGTVSIEVSSTDTDTDTRTDVSDGGTQVVAEVTDINFGTDLSVTDDTDGTVTVDSTASGGGGSASKTTARRYGLLGGD